MRERDAFLCRNVKNMTNYVLHIWGHGDAEKSGAVFVVQVYDKGTRSLVLSDDRRSK